MCCYTDGSPGRWCLYDDHKAAKFIPWEQVSHRQASVAVYNRCHLRQQPLGTPNHTVPAPLKANVPQSHSLSQACSHDCGAAYQSSSSSQIHLSVTCSSSSHHELPPIRPILASGFIPSKPISTSPYAACSGEKDAVCSHGEHTLPGPTGSILSDARQPYAVAAHQAEPIMSKPIAKAGVPSAGAVTRSMSRHNSDLSNAGKLLSVCLCLCLSV